MVRIGFSCFLLAVLGSSYTSASDIFSELDSVIDNPQLTQLALTSKQQLREKLHPLSEQMEAERLRHEATIYTMEAVSVAAGRALKSSHDERLGFIEKNQIIKQEIDETSSSIQSLILSQAQREKDFFANASRVATPGDFISSFTSLKRQNTTEIRQLTEYRKQKQIDENIEIYPDLPLERAHNIGLSIDGGGMRGIIPALILAHIEEESHKRIYELFDFVGGASIGGILALGLTTPTESGVLSGRQSVELFEREGTSIFPFVSLKGFRQIFASAYSSEGIERVLGRYFPPQITLRETLRPVLITATKTDHRGFLFETTKARLDLMHNFYIKDVARATSAAPTYFPAARICSVNGERYNLVDGGVWCNNPARLVYNAMIDLDNDPGSLHNPISVIAVGTGENYPRPIFPQAGLMHGGRIIQAMFHANTNGVDAEMKQILGDQFYRIQPSLDIEVELDETQPQYLDFLKASAEEKYLDTENVIRFLLKNYDLKREIV